jgi:uncharacterized protein (TIGR03435 family)
MGPSQLVGVGARLVLLVNQLSRILEADVVDKTGLTGRYDFTVNWEPEAESARTGASIFTALRESTGLRLQPARGPVEIVVIDSVEKPGAN